MRIIAVDVGTTNLKASVIEVGEKDFRVLESIVERIPPEIPELGAYEHNPRVIEDLLKKLLKHLSRWKPEILSLSTYLFGIMLVDSTGTPLTNIITWMDDRALHSINELKKYSEDLYIRTGCPLIHIYALPKILWLKKTKKFFNKTHEIRDAKSYLMQKLIGYPVTDLSTASGTYQMLNIRELKWDELALELADIDEEQLPQLSEGDTLYTLPKSLAIEIGINPDTTVILGLYDGGMMIYGGLKIAEGSRIAVVNLGTSAMLRIPTNTPVIDIRTNLARFQTYYLIKGVWLSGGAINNAGSVIEWLLRVFNIKTIEFSNIIDETENIETDIIFIPLLLPERLPFIDPALRGTITNLRISTTNLEIIKAAIEGIFFMLKIFDEALVENRITYTTTIVGGGLARKPILKILANILNKIVIKPEIDLTMLGHTILVLETLGGRSLAKNIIENIIVEQIEPKAYEKYMFKYSQFKEMLRKLGVATL